VKVELRHWKFSTKLHICRAVFTRRMLHRIRILRQSNRSDDSIQGLCFLGANFVCCPTLAFAFTHFPSPSNALLATSCCNVQQFGFLLNSQLPFSSGNTYRRPKPRGSRYKRSHTTWEVGSYIPCSAKDELTNLIRGVLYSTVNNPINPDESGAG
jgi:hypothetical protein